MEKTGSKHTDELYQTWSSMRTRCNNPNRSNYEFYGGRGIRVCQRWDSFDNFKADMGERPKGYTLDRIDNDADYCPSNCRWASRSEQKVNSRPSRRSKSGIRGLGWNEAEQVWKVRLYRHGRLYYGGSHRDIEDAKTSLNELLKELGEC